MPTMDFYHKTTTFLKKTEIEFTEEHKLFALFIRDKETYFTPPDPFKLFEDIVQFTRENNLNVEVSVLGCAFNKGLLPVTAQIPIVYVLGTSMDAIQLESFLINRIQLDLIYTTRLLKIGNIVERYFPNAALLEFGLRRAPSIEAANRFSEIAVNLGYYTSNLNIPIRGYIRGTLPHAFIQEAIFSKKGEKEELLNREVRLWKDLILNRRVNIILPDTIDYKLLLDKLLSDEQVLNFVKRNKLGIRIDTTDKVTALRELNAIASKYGVKQHIKYILSGDLNEESIIQLTVSLTKEEREQVVGIAIGTQVVNNISPLSIVYKLVQRGNTPVYKLSPGKSQLSGYHLVQYDSNMDPILIEADKFRPYDHGIYPLI